jgi:hypothetical protein
MTTTMEPPAPAVAPSGGGLRFVPIRANLLPDEIVSGRQTEVVRKQVLFGLVVLIVALIGWYAASWVQTTASNSDLRDAERQGVAYQNQQSQFGPLVRAQSDVQSIQLQLQKLMVGDLPWTSMLTTLRTKAPSGITVSAVTANVTADSTTNAAAAAPAPLNQSGKAAVGQLTVSGSAPDKKSVAAYADRLATVKGLTAPLVSNVTATGRTVTFTMDVVITSDALGGRYAVVATPVTTGGH